MGYSKSQKSLINRVKNLQLRLSPDVSVNDLTVNQVSKQLNIIHREAIGKAPGDIYTGGVIIFERRDELLLLLSVSLSPRQSGTGNPSLSNIRPISGYNAVNVYIRGFNQWDEEWEVGGINHSTGANNNSVSTVIRSKNYIPCFEKTVYFLHMPSGTGIDAYMHFYDANKNYISHINVGTNKTFNTPPNAYYIRFNASAYYGTTYNHDICINLSGENNGKYEPYNPASAEYLITLPQPIYGGAVNVLTGEISSTWALIDSYAGETLPGEWISDRDVYTPGGVPSSGAQVCYKLETPASSYTTGANVILLDGYNAIWSAEGETEAIIL